MIFPPLIGSSMLLTISPCNCLNMLGWAHWFIVAFEVAKCLLRVCGVPGGMHLTNKCPPIVLYSKCHREPSWQVYLNGELLIGPTKLTINKMGKNRLLYMRRRWHHCYIACAGLFWCTRNWWILSKVDCAHQKW